MFSVIQARFTIFEIANGYVICLSANLPFNQFKQMLQAKYNVKLHRLLSVCSYWLIAFTDLLAVNDLKHQHGSKKILNLISLSIDRSLPLYILSALKYLECLCFCVCLLETNNMLFHFRVIIITDIFLHVEFK